MPRLDWLARAMGLADGNDWRTTRLLPRAKAAGITTRVTSRSLSLTANAGCSGTTAAKAGLSKSASPRIQARILALARRYLINDLVKSSTETMAAFFWNRDSAMSWLSLLS